MLDDEEDRHVIQLESAARIFFEQMATVGEQIRLGEILRGLTYEPEVDYELKHPFNSPPNSVIYYDGEFWIIYEILGRHSILALNIGFEEEIPSTERGAPQV